MMIEIEELLKEGGAFIPIIFGVYLLVKQKRNKRTGNEKNYKIGDTLHWRGGKND